MIALLAVQSCAQTFIPPTNEVCEGYVVTGVCVCPHGGGPCIAKGGGMHGRGTCVVGACMVGGACVAGGHAWQKPRDTINERAVCILLECILVHNAIMLIDTPDNASHNQDHWLIRTPYLSMKASNDTPSVSVSMNTRPLETSQCLNLRPIHTDRKRKGKREFPLMFEFFPFVFAFVYCK